ncbi:MAG: glycerophosphodiester phosphodiesterase family protein [Deltaproteobacteria bacterium]|nr:glycerophosphodiester phosphodiesterase family protein [Deltaproteobacteria bacterium]
MTERKNVGVGGFFGVLVVFIVLAPGCGTGSEPTGGVADAGQSDSGRAHEDAESLGGEDPDFDAASSDVFVGGEGGEADVVSSPDGGETDGEVAEDSGTRPDSGGEDAGIPDSGADTGWDGGIPDSGIPDAGMFDAGHDVGSAVDSGVDAGVDAGSGPSHKSSLSVCWTDASCHRALVVSHGGNWNVGTMPFLSRKAFESAWQLGADGIEADVRVTKDGVPVIAHSSPIEFYESLDCAGKKIEEMTAAEVTKCHLAPSTTETIQRLDDLLEWSKAKLIMHLDVKETADLPATFATIIAKGASDRAFIAAGTGELANDIPKIAGWDQLFYMARVRSGAEATQTVSVASAQRIFMFEMDRSYGDAAEAQLSDIIRNVMIPGGVKAFCASDKSYITEQVHVDMYHQGFDGILSYALPAGISAAQKVNAERGYPP